MKLHLGAFDQPKDGWYNTDITPHIFVSRLPFCARFLSSIGKMSSERIRQHNEGVFRKLHYLNVAKRFPLADDSAEAVFSSHMIEHLRPPVARHMLAECLRVLKPGGICRVVAPSLEWALALYSEENPYECLKSIFEHEYANTKNRHQWMYTESSLVGLFDEIGFVDVRPAKYQEGRLPDVELLDNRPENSIYIEGMKG